MTAPGDVGNGQYRETAREVEQNTEITTVHAINQHATEEGHDEAGQGDDDDLPAYGNRRMRGRHDVPAHADKVHAAAEQRDKHRRKEIAEAALLPEQRPVNPVDARRGHGAYQFTIPSRRLA